MQESLSLEKELAQFLRKKRGNLTFAQFAKKIGLTDATLCRLETGQQNVTLRSLKLIMKRTNSTLTDIFPGHVRK